MGKSCLDGYLTPACKKCGYWINSRMAVGCECPFPIAQCPAFSAMEKLDSAKTGSSVNTEAHDEGVILKKDMDSVEALVRFKDGTLMWVDSILLSY